MSMVITDDKHYTNIASKIREKTASNDKIPPSDMSEKIDDVYDAGKDNGIRAMWECIQAGGTKDIGGSIMSNSGWAKETFKPIYDIRPTSCYLWSRNCPTQTLVNNLTPETQIDIVELEKEQGIVFDFGSVTSSTSYDYAFVGALFKRWNVIDISKGKTISGTFYGGYLPSGRRKELAPKRIERLICGETNVFSSNAFQYAIGYEYIGFEGVIASSINVSWSPLNKESLTKLLSTLSDTATGQTVSVNLEAVNKAFETSEGLNDGNTSEEWQSLVGTKPNWTVSLV